MNELADNSVFKDKSNEEIAKLINPPARNRAPQALVEQLVIPGYISGPYKNQDVKGKPEWEGNIKYQRDLFAREFQKAVSSGKVEESNREQLTSRFHQYLDDWINLKDGQAQSFYEQQTNIENVRTSSRIINLILYGDIDYDTGAALKPIADQANAIAREALKEGLFQDVLTQLKTAQTQSDRIVALREILKMALHASAPLIRFSDPKFQALPDAVKKVRDLLPQAIEQKMAVDSSADFIREVVEIKEPQKIAYLFDDNGDAIYHLHLIQALLEINPNLSFTLIAKQVRIGVDSTYQDLEQEISQPEFAVLAKFKQSGRLSVLSEGPEFAGVNMRNASTAMLETIRDASLLVTFGTSTFENMNGVNKPAYHMAYVDSPVAQKATGLSQGSLFFVRVKSGERYYSVFQKAMANAVAIVQETFKPKSLAIKQRIKR